MDVKGKLLVPWRIQVDGSEFVVYNSQGAAVARVSGLPLEQAQFVAWSIVMAPRLIDHLYRSGPMSLRQQANELWRNLKKTRKGEVE